MSTNDPTKPERGVVSRIIVIAGLLVVLAGLAIFGNYQYVSRWRFAKAWENLEKIRLYQRPKKKQTDIHEYMGKPPVASYSPREGVYVEQFSWPDAFPAVSYRIYVIYKAPVDKPPGAMRYYLAVKNRVPGEDDFP